MAINHEVLLGLKGKTSENPRKIGKNICLILDLLVYTASDTLLRSTIAPYISAEDILANEEMSLIMYEPEDLDCSNATGCKILKELKGFFYLIIIHGFVGTPIVRD